MARIKIYDNNKKEWVYADKSFSKTTTTEYIHLANYNFTTTEGVSLSYEAAIMDLLQKSRGDVERVTGIDLNSSLFSLVYNKINEGKDIVFLANFNEGVVLWKPELLFLSDGELQLSFSAFIYLNHDVLDIKIVFNLFSDMTTDIFLCAKHYDIIQEPS